ncbi:MAG: ribonuclease J [Alphaproteobacteria bacterium]|nr:ribonuclease J [Alphaproteobacteria bacterium]
MSGGWGPKDLVFLPLGGAGEIGMNLNLYGHAGKWLMVDLGITFPGEGQPGIDVITPDPSYIADRRQDLLGLVLTHAHEDHLGAVPYLWSSLRCPVYATPFSAAVLRGKLAEAGLLGEVPLTEVPLGARFKLGPFGIQFLSITHSIPEPNALVIRTPLGTILHTGDWKLDPAPVVGRPTEEAAFRAVGDEGVLALVCDSTNVFNPGHSGSEAALEEGLGRLVAGQSGRVAVTTFASNLARAQTVARVARAHDRQLAVVGRSLLRMLDCARATGYADGLENVLSEAEGGHLPAGKALYLCTGCQGEPRGAMARIAAGEHRHLYLERGDLAIFSSKVIPGNEAAIARVQNRLVEGGVRVIGEHDAFVHVSGHPCREELAQMYRWARPRIAVPVHGELRHLVEHAAFASSLQVPEAPVVRNGQVLRLAPGPAEVVEEVPAGRWYADQDVLLPEGSGAVHERRKLMQSGGAQATLVLDHHAEPAALPRLSLTGIAARDPAALLRAGEAALADLLEDLPLAVLRDDARLEEAARRALHAVLRQNGAKRPLVTVQIVRLDAPGRSRRRGGRK